MTIFRVFPSANHKFHAHLAALLTCSMANDWSTVAHSSEDDRECFGSLDTQHCGFSASKLVHKDGRVAQIEYDAEDWIFFDCEEVSWSGPLEDDAVSIAEANAGGIMDGFAMEECFA